MTVRALYRAVALPGAEPPSDRVTLKLPYPARLSDSPEERNTGLVMPDPDALPCPVVLLLPGINVGPEAYGWLAIQLAEAGVVTVCLQLIAEEMPGMIGLTPGLRLDRLSAGGYGDGPSSTTIGPVLEALAQWNDAPGVLQGLLDLDHVILGGHSAGGTLALLNANSEWFPGVCGAFSYGAHTAAAEALGHPPSTYLEAWDCPVLLAGGDVDEVITASGGRYGDADVNATDRLETTFERSLPASGSHLVVLRGANHFTFAHPVDGTTGRAFLDGEETMDGTDTRRFLGTLIARFIDECMTGDASAPPWNDVAGDTRVSRYRAR